MGDEDMKFLCSKQYFINLFFLKINLFFYKFTSFEYTDNKNNILKKYYFNIFQNTLKNNYYSFSKHLSLLLFFMF